MSDINGGNNRGPGGGGGGGKKRRRGGRGRSAGNKRPTTEASDHANNNGNNGGFMFPQTSAVPQPHDHHHMQYATHGPIGNAPLPEYAQQPRQNNSNNNGGNNNGGNNRNNGGNKSQMGRLRPTQHQANRVSEDFLAAERFDDLPLDDRTKRAIREQFGYDRCTKVQSATLTAVAQGKDVLAKALTGTGKTMAFLIPTIERLASTQPKGNSGSNGGPPIRALVLSPTRELAQQIHTECRELLKYHSLRSTVCVGGTNIKSEQRKLNEGRIDILVATPGRFIDHLKNTNSIAQRVSGIQTLTMDEADRMLEMGFRPAIDEILSFLPPPNTRQTLLYSATVPRELVKIAPEVLAAEFLFVDTVKDTIEVAKATGGGKSYKTGSSKAKELVADDPIATASQVSQDFLVTPLENQMHAVYHLLAEERANDPDHKIMVFFTTARLTQLYAEVFNLAGHPTLEIHSRKSQSQRQKASDNFKNTIGVTMFSSDVTARGMDYPDVTYVLQVGVPSDKEQYVHRLGRTARAGKKGRGTLVLSDFETYFLGELRGLPLTERKMETPMVPAVVDAVKRAPPITKITAYQSWLGFYNSQRGLKWGKPKLVEWANFFSKNALLLNTPPALQKKTIGKMGLKGVPGLVIDNTPFNGGGRGGGGGGRGGGGGGGRGRGRGGRR